MQKLFFCIVIALSLLGGCKRLPDVQGAGSAMLQGVWKQDSVVNSDKLLNFTKHDFKFSCDSFYVNLTTYSKVNYYSDSCFNNGVWPEYAKGVYEVRNDSLFLLGTYTKANYKQKLSGCYQIGQYIKSFKILMADSAIIELESTDNQRLIVLALKEKIVCIPREL